MASGLFWIPTVSASFVVMLSPIPPMTESLPWTTSNHVTTAPWSNAFMCKVRSDSDFSMNVPTRSIATPCVLMKMSAPAAVGRSFMSQKSTDLLLVFSLITSPVFTLSQSWDFHRPFAPHLKVSEPVLASLTVISPMVTVQCRILRARVLSSSSHPSDMITPLFPSHRDSAHGYCAMQNTAGQSVVIVQPSQRYDHAVGVCARGQFTERNLYLDLIPLGGIVSHLRLHHAESSGQRHRRSTSCCCRRSLHICKRPEIEGAD